MSPYNRNERRGILLLAAAVVIAVCSMFLVRECGSRGDEGSRRAEQIILTDSLRKAKADSSGDAQIEKKRKQKRERKAAGRKRKGASRDDFRSRDILADTIATALNKE